MNSKKNFTEDDKSNLVKYLNSVAKHATWTHNTEELINYFKLLSFMQQVLLPKVDSHIFEVLRVVDQQPETSQVSETNKTE